MTTQTLIWYTPEEKMPDVGKPLVYEISGSVIWNKHGLKIGSGSDFELLTTRWAYLDESINLPVMFAEWLRGNANFIFTDEWSLYNSNGLTTYTTEQLFKEFLKTL